MSDNKTNLLSCGCRYVYKDDIKAVASVLLSSFLTTGPKVDALEAELCALTGAKHAVACSNSTAVQQRKLTLPSASSCPCFRP